MQEPDRNLRRPPFEPGPISRLMPGSPSPTKGESSTRRVVPFAGANLYLITYGLEHPENPPVRATSDADGRFRFTVPKSDFDTYHRDTPWADG